MSGSKAGAEIFMFLQAKGKFVEGECSTVLALPNLPPDPLLEGFRLPNMFEITRFTFGVGAKDGEGDDDLKKVLKGFADKPDANPGERKAVDRWAQKNKRDARKDKPDKDPEPDPISVTRLMDKASTSLLRHIVDGTYFDRVAILKRKQAGGASAGQPYLRLDFEGVIITDLSMSNEDPIEETYTLQCRRIFLQYCPQLPNGELGAPVPGLWDMAKKT